MLEQSKNFDTLVRPQENRWLVESFASRAALFGFIYLCVNIIYQQGYLSRLGFEFGLFSIARTFSLLFDNFLIAAYAFITWGFIIKVTPSTYDQLFGLFNPISWRDSKVSSYRFAALAFVAIIYLVLHKYYLEQSNIIDFAAINWPVPLLSAPDVSFKIFRDVVSKLLIPTWGFVFWLPSVLCVTALNIGFRYLNKKYRKIRRQGLYQLLDKNHKIMFFQINLVTPALSILAGFFFLIMIPGFIGSETATLTLKNIHISNDQRVDKIELSGVSSFCDLPVVQGSNSVSWESTSSDDFTIHLLGTINEHVLFVVIRSPNTNTSTGVPKSNAIHITPCLVSSGTINMISLDEDIIH